MSFVSVQNYNKADLFRLFAETKAIKKALSTDKRSCEDIAAGRMLGMMFYEPSTRTSGSFEKAFKFLGGRIYDFNIAASSIAKGESLNDTARMVASGTDMLIVRHKQAGICDHLANNILSIPVINAGEGTGEHPTQALLDMYTIQEHFGQFNITIGIMGDMAYGRTTHSLIRMASALGANIICIASDDSLQMPPSYIQEAEKNGATVTCVKRAEDVIDQIDALYVTRLQRERLPDELHHQFDQQVSGYRVTNSLINRMPSDGIVLHPLPRLDELPEECDTNQRARYFQQAENGIYTRMALMARLLNRPFTP